MRFLFMVMALALVAGCGGGSATSPDVASDDRIESALGYHIERADYQGPVTQAHAELADRWWIELMADLRTAGYSEAQTDPSKHVEFVYIYLYQPRDSDHSIVCPGRPELVGACYDQFKPAFRVPGTYIDGPMLGRRPASQALKHEMLHHWCLWTFDNLCMAPGASEWDGHVWKAPNGTNVWDYTWH